MVNRRGTWTVLKEVAKAHFAHLRSKYPNWTISDVLDNFHAKGNGIILQLVEEAGFYWNPACTQDQVIAVAGRFAAGITTARAIAFETRIPQPLVEAILERIEAGYGSSPYGKKYGRNRAISIEGNPVKRKVTTMGQISYRGKRYTLGMSYSGHVASVVEKGDRLIADFQDRPCVVLTCVRGYKNS